MTTRPVLQRVSAATRDLGSCDRVRDTLANRGLAPDEKAGGQLAQANTAEIGKGATELAWALFRPDEATAMVRARVGWECVERLRAEGRPILFVTPHLGSY